MSYSVFMVTQTYKTHPMTNKLNPLFSFRAQRRKTDRSASALESLFFFSSSSDTCHVLLCTLPRDKSVSLLSSSRKDPTSPSQTCCQSGQSGQIRGQNGRSSQSETQHSEEISLKELFFSFSDNISDSKGCLRRLETSLVSTHDHSVPYRHPLSGTAINLNHDLLFTNLASKIRAVQPQPHLQPLHTLPGGDHQPHLQPGDQPHLQPGDLPHVQPRAHQPHLLLLSLISLRLLWSQWAGHPLCSISCPLIPQPGDKFPQDQDWTSGHGTGNGWIWMILFVSFNLPAHRCPFIYCDNIVACKSIVAGSCATR